MILHFGSIYQIRNGIQMTKYVIYHSEEFDHPISAFLLGVLVIVVSTLCELTNLFKSLSQTKITDVISKFVAFRILVQTPEYYTRSRANFRIKGAVRANPLVIVTDSDRVLALSDQQSADSNSLRNSQYETLLLNASQKTRESVEKGIGRQKNRRCLILTMFYIYKFLRTFYTTIYFYFFPLLAIMVPFIYII